MTIPRISPYPMPSVEEFPKNRVNWQIDPSRTVLLIHDMQNYFLNFYDMGESPIPDLIQNILTLRQSCRSQGIPVFYTAQPAKQSDADRGLLGDFWGAGLGAYPSQEVITEQLQPGQGDRVLTKWRYSAFHRTELLSYLQQENRDRLILCGVYGHIGCLITACEAFMNDIQTFLVGDAVADFSWEYHHMAMNYVSQRCGMTVSSQAVVDALSDSHADGMQAETDLSSSVSVTEALRQQLGELLQQPPQEFGVEENLLDWGLDSIRLMNLVEMWRQKGVEVSFTDLAEEPTIAAWTQRLVDDRAIGHSREESYHF